MDHERPAGSGRTATRWALPIWASACVFIGIAGFFLWTEHRAHLMGALPYVLLLLCPILHLFAHRGHVHHGPRSDRPEHDGRGIRGRAAQ